MSKPKSLEELLTSKKFRELLTGKTQAEFGRRQMILDVAEKSEFKSDAFSCLLALDKMNVDDLVTEFLLIDNRQSDLASRLRNYIYPMVIDLLQQTEQYYHKGKEIVYE